MNSITGPTRFGGGIIAVTTLAGQRLHLSTHSVERYQERVKPHLSLAEAADDACRLLALAGSRLPQAPPWTSPSPKHKRHYVALGPDVVFAVGRCGRCLVATTCLTPRVARHRRRRVDRVPARRRLLGSPQVAAGAR